MTDRRFFNDMKRLQGALDLGGRHGDAIPVLQLVVGRDRLAVDPDEEVVGVAVALRVPEERHDSGVIIDPLVVCKTGAVVIDEKNCDHGEILKALVKQKGRHTGCPLIRLTN